VSISAVLPLTYLYWLKTEYLEIGNPPEENRIPMGVKFRGRVSPAQRRIRRGVENFLAERGYAILTPRTLAREVPGLRMAPASPKAATLQNLLFGPDDFRSRT
jgi:hypothetical protein